MDTRALTDDLTVSAQITAEDVPTIAAAGFRSILCNRPDGEAPGQPAYAEIEAAARAAGLAVAYQPVSTALLNEADAAEFGRLVATLPAPVFAYCRSGTRCGMLWQLSRR